METLAVHVLVDLHGCPFELLDDDQKLRQALLEAATVARTTVLAESFQKFQPQGVSGVLLVSESHLSIHTWPEWGYAAVDLFSCGDRAALADATRYLVKALRAKHHTVGRAERGMLDQRRSILPLEFDEVGVGATV